MNGKRMLGAVTGALAMGLGLSVMMVLQEKTTGEASEVTMLARKGAARLGARAPAGSQPPRPQERAFSQGGHLLLSALGGVVFASLVDEDADVLPSGIAFGLAFYATAHAIVGPALGLTEPEWEADLPTVGMHTATHVLYGLATALGAKIADRA